MLLLLVHFKVGISRPDLLSLCKWCKSYQFSPTAMNPCLTFCCCFCFFEGKLYSLMSQRALMKYIPYSSETTLVSRWLRHLPWFPLILVESPVRCQFWLFPNHTGRNKQFSGIMWLWFFVKTHLCQPRRKLGISTKVTKTQNPNPPPEVPSLNNTTSIRVLNVANTNTHWWHFSVTLKATS